MTMKRILKIGILLIGIYLGFPYILHATVLQGDAPTLFSCQDRSKYGEKKWKELEKVFIKNPETQILTNVCNWGDIYYVLREDRTETSTKLRAGIYFSKTNKKYMERYAHPVIGYCEIEAPKNIFRPAKFRLDYLCYQPQVAAAQSAGEEFSFRAKKRKTMWRPCTVFFGGDTKRQCGEFQKFP